MSQLKLTADSGGGTVAIKAPSSTTGNAALELLVPSTASDTLDSLKRTGNILQVVQDTKTDTFTTTSATDVEVTGLAVAITPSSSSNKVLITVNLGLVGANTNGYPGLTLYREIGGSATNLAIGTSGTSSQPNVTLAGNLHSRTDYSGTAASMSFLDSPNTTSEITYKLKIRSGYNNINVYINRQHATDDANYIFRTASTYIAQEVAA